VPDFEAAAGEHDVPQSQRRAAALAYLTAVPFGPVVPMLVLIVFRAATPKFARFHAIQAAAQYAYVVAAAMVALVFIIPTSIIGFLRTPPEEFAAAPPTIMLVGTLCGGGLVLLVVAIQIVAAPFLAAMAWRGRMFRLPIIGRVLAADLDTL
jgi:uncharacterized membrane protein